MKFLAMKPSRWMQAAPIFSVAAQSVGLNPVYGLALQVLTMLAAMTLIRLIQTEPLKAFAAIALQDHLPQPIRRQIELGDFDFDQRQTMEQAIIGIVDIAASAQLSNQVGMKSDFELKKTFMKKAFLRAEQFGMLILNHTGDGFLFIANHSDSDHWQKNLRSFHVALTMDFKNLLNQLEGHSGQKTASGLRFGISSGSVIMGCLGANPTHFTATGITVNLAARLSDVAACDQIVFSEQAWNQAQGAYVHAKQCRILHQVKGFDVPVLGIHVEQPELFEVSQNEPTEIKRAN